MYFNQKSILAADYLRLSREDGDKLESDSIRNQRYAYWFPLSWSQRDDSSSLVFTASCKIFSFLCGTFMQKGALNDKTKKR